MMPEHLLVLAEETWDCKAVISSYHLLFFHPNPPPCVLRVQVCGQRWPPAQERKPHGVQPLVTPRDVCTAARSRETSVFSVFVGRGQQVRKERVSPETPITDGWKREGLMACGRRGGGKSGTRSRSPTSRIPLLPPPPPPPAQVLAPSPQTGKGAPWPLAAPGETGSK